MNAYLQSLPFHAFPARRRHPVLGLCLIAISYLLPIALLIANGVYAYRTTFGAPVVRPFLGIHTLVGLLLTGALCAAILVSRRMFTIGFALRQPDAIELLKTDRRAPVLYLRSFNDDGVPDLTSSVIPFGPRQTIETRLSRVFRGIGPVVSIGRPGERLPEVGANRFYVSDNDWQRAVLYFIDRAAAVIIMIGRSKGVAWEIDTALRTVPRERLLLMFPYLLPKEKRTLTRMAKDNVRLRGRGDDSVSKAMLADLQQEHELRYTAFREQFGNQVSANLPARLDNGVFLDFFSDGLPRRLPVRRPLLVRRQRDRQGLTLDYERTLRPFLQKLQDGEMGPDRIELFFTNRYTLALFTTVCFVAFLCCFGFPFVSGFEPIGLVVFFLGTVPGNLAYWGVWNLSRHISLAAVIARLMSAAAGGWLGSVFGWVVYSAGLLPENAQAYPGALVAAFIDGTGGAIAGLIAGFRFPVWRWAAVVMTTGLALVLAGAMAAGLTFQSSDRTDAGDVLAVAYPCLAVAGAIWGVIRLSRRTR